MTNLLSYTIYEISRRIRSGEISPVKLTEETLKEIERVNPSLNAFITILHSQALKDAEPAERLISEGKYIGPLQGIPIAVKDNIFIENVRCTAGSKILENQVASYDATVIGKIKAAGSVIIGTANLHEFASGVTSNNPFYGAVRNPWDLERIPGGSSGGSAASVAAGLAFAALGTDTSGSVRIPAALCGVVGLKPTFGRISKYGVIPLSSSLDHVGVITRSVMDAAFVLQTISGYDEHDPTTVKADVPDYSISLEDTVSGMRVGVVSEYFQDILSDEVREAFDKFVDRLSSLGAVPEEITLDGFNRVESIWSTIRFSEASAFLSEWMKSRPSDIGADVLEKLKFGLSYSAVEYIKSLELMESMRKGFQQTLRGVDVIVTPATPIVAPKMDEKEIEIGEKEYNVYSILTRLAFPFNVSGVPAIVVPIGVSRDGLPIAAQIVGGPFREDLILRLAHHYELKYGPFQTPRIQKTLG